MRTLIVYHSHPDPLLDNLKRLLQSKYGVGNPLAVPAEQLDSHLTPQPPDLIVICLCTATPEKTLDVVRRLRDVAAVHTIVAGQAADPKLILGLLQAGAELFVDEADLESQFAAGLARLRLKTGEAGTPGRIISVLSASGGCGASTLAVNVAAVLAQSHGKCGLIDLNAGHGDLPSLLDVKPQYTLADVCLNESRLDRAMFENMLVRHDSGIHLLAAAPNLEDIRTVTARGVEQALTLCQELTGCVVVDHEDCLHDEQVAVLKRASSILLICRLGFTSLRHTKRICDRLGSLAISRQKIKIVVNQYGQQGELPLDEAEHALGEKLKDLVCYEPKAINMANSAGVPVVGSNGNSKLTQSIVALVKPKSEIVSNGSVLLPGLRLWRKAMGATE